MRPKRAGDGGEVRRWRTVLAVWLGFALVGPSASPASTGPLGTNVATDKFMIVLDTSQDTSEISLRLAEAGFPSIERIRGLPSRHDNFRLVQVPVSDVDTKAELLAVDGVQAVRPVYAAADADYPILSNGQVIVRFQPATPREQVTALAAWYGSTVVREIQGLPQVYVFDVDETEQSASQAAQALATESSVLYSHPSLLFKLKKHQTTPIDDTLYPFQWHLNNTGQIEGALPDADIDAPEAWSITMGLGAVVAVIDDSIQRDHEDLMDNYLIGYDFLDQDGDPSPTYGPFYWFYDPVGEAHGTAVSGLICARANTVGVRGVAPFANLIGCKIGLGYFYTSDQDVADAFLFAERNGAMAINNSWGAPGGALLPTIPNTYLLPNLVSDAIDEVATNGRGGKGVLVLFSAGNGDRFLGDPIPIAFGNMYAAWPNVMSIGATLRNDLITCYSNFGPEQSVVAPGGGFSYPRSQEGGLELPWNWDECFESDMATTDNTQTPGFWPYDFDGDGQPEVGWPIRGYNPPIKFLDVMDPSSCLGPYDFFCAPLVPNLEITDFPDESYTHHFNGTSASCPVATGVAALVFSVNPNLTAEQARNLIEHTADKIQAPNETFDAVTGHNERYGHGRVNALRAVEAAVAGRNWPSPVEDTLHVSSQALIRIFWTNPENDVAAVLIARCPTGQLDWAPTDGIEYTVGQQVAPGVVIVANSLIERLDQTGLSAGQFDYALFVRNASHYYSWGRRFGFESTGTVTVPLASLSASPRTGKAPLSVHFAGGAIDPSGLKTLQFSWDFGDGGTAVGPAVDHVYTVPDEYTVTLTVTNASGQSAKATTRIVVSSEANLSPQASIAAYPTSGDAPLVVVFEGVGTDLDGYVVRYEWNFGDGTVAMGQVVEHTYISPAIYGATLTVTDNQGATGIDSVLINVTGPGTTAAQTVPQDLLNVPPECGTGLPVAAIGTVIGMFALTTLRRRR